MAFGFKCKAYWSFGTLVGYFLELSRPQIYQIQQDCLKRINFKFQQPHLPYPMNSTPQKATKPQIQSPFVDCVTQCRTSMRKLRKKIYKHIKYNPEYHKPLSQPTNTPSSLKKSSFPQHLLDKIKVSSKINLQALQYTDVQNLLPIAEIKRCADRQQNETRIILQQWKNTSNIEKQSQISKSSAKKAKPGRWIASTQIQNEESQLSPLVGLQEGPFVNCFEQLQHQKISSSLRENSLLEICSNIFDESNLYEFK